VKAAVAQPAPQPVRLGARQVGAGHPPFIVAEMSGNHNQSLERALAIVDAAARAGAHAVKIQTYTADTMTLDVDGQGFRIEDANSLWSGRTLYDLYKEAHTPWEWHRPIFERCAQHGMVGFSSPFDATAVDFLETLGAPCYKIASFETTGKPVIISTGMASEEELGASVQAARAAGCRDLILLKCTSTYPASSENTNLRTIPDIAERFACLAGLSDHTMGIGAAVAGVAMGAVLIEKHFTLSRAEGGVDATFSLEPEELRALSVETERAWQALGAVRYGPTAPETKSLAYRRSLYIVKDLRAGEALSADNLRAIRPGHGLPPRFYDELLGRVLARDVKRGTPVDWDLLAPQRRG
jgi:pseudaminic acid synthase